MNNVYRSVRDESTEIELLKVDERASTYMVKFLNGDKKGETTVYSKSTIKRWWRKVDNVVSDKVISDDENKKSEQQTQQVNTTEKRNLLDYVGELVSGYNVNYKRNKTMVIFYTLVNNKKKRYAYIYKRKNCLRIYVPEKYYDLVSEKIKSYIIKVVNDGNDVSFYVPEEGINNVIKILCKEMKSNE